MLFPTVEFAIFFPIVLALSWALIGIDPADNKPAPAVMAVCMNRRRFSELCMMYSSLMKLRCLNSREYDSAKLEHQ